MWKEIGKIALIVLVIMALVKQAKNYYTPLNNIL